MLESMKNADAILQLCGDIDRLESEADFVFRSALASFPRGIRRAADPEAEGGLRAARVDHRQCEDVANVIEGIVLENA